MSFKAWKHIDQQSGQERIRCYGTLKSLPSEESLAVNPKSGKSYGFASATSQGKRFPRVIIAGSLLMGGTFDALLDEEDAVVLERSPYVDASGVERMGWSVAPLTAPNDVVTDDEIELVADPYSVDASPVKETA